MSMISELVDRLRVEAKSMGTYGTDYMATLLMRSADTIVMLSEKVREPKEVVMPKKCKGCDSASKIIEAYSQGFKDGADAVKAMSQTFTAEGIVFAKMDEPSRSEKPNNSKERNSDA